MKIGPEKFGDEVASGQLDLVHLTDWKMLHVLQGRNEDVAKAYDLQLMSACWSGVMRLTFSCLRCLRSFSSRKVRLARTGVLNGFMIFLTATAWPVI